MLDASTIRLDRVDPSFAMPFNHRLLDGSVLVTNDLGDWIFLTPAEFQRFIEGDIPKEDPLYDRLATRNFIAAEVNIQAQVERFREKKGFLFQGPTLHGIVLTERCNHGCQYCHSSVVGMNRFDTDMGVKAAERAVDFALKTTSPWLGIEFQGGEPTANWDVIEHIVLYGQKQNLVAKKQLSFSLVTNFSLMTEEMLDFLMAHRVQICTSLDGPEDLHNKIRIYKGGNAHKLVTKWIARVNERYAEMGLDTNLYRVEALPTITRDSLSRPKEIVDEFVKNGCRAIFMRKLDPFGFAEVTMRKLGYTMDEFVEFFLEAFEYIVELNKQGVQVMERNAAIMMSKILGDTDPNYLDLRTPGGAVIGQLGYHPDGGIYTSDEGRMVAAMGDEIFRVGDTTMDYHELMRSDTVRAMVLASTNDSHPDCVQCTYKAWCGQQPEYNYKTQGSIHGRMVDSIWCRKHKKIFDYLMVRLRDATDEEHEIFQRWIQNREQDHFLQDTEEEGAEGAAPVAESVPVPA